MKRINITVLVCFVLYFFSSIVVADCSPGNCHSSGVALVKFEHGILDKPVGQYVIPTNMMNINSASLESLLTNYGVYQFEKVLKNEIEYDTIGYRNDNTTFRKYDLSQLYVLFFPESVDVKEFVDAIGNLSSIISVTPNYIYREFFSPNDPSYISGDQWGLDSIDAPNAWDITTGSNDISIAFSDFMNILVV